MVNQIVEAVYEHGTLRLLGPLNAEEGQRVRLVVEVIVPTSSEEDPLGMLVGFYDGLAEEDIKEIEEIMLDRSGWQRSGTPQ